MSTRQYSKKIFILICCVLPLFLAGCTPRVTIIEPVNGDTFEAGEKIVFKGQATDLLHPNLDENAFVWTSDKDGEIGMGTSFESSNLSEGEHTITLTVTDPDGLARQSSVSITITITITPRFTDNNNGTVTDARTGLVWLKNANPCGSKNWYDAGTYCASLANGTAGLTDGSTAGQWRLPSLQELEGIGTDPPVTWEGPGYPSVPWTMPGTPFTDVQSHNYWSGTSYAYSAGVAWTVDVGNGFVHSNGKSLTNPYVWAVRDGN